MAKNRYFKSAQSINYETQLHLEVLPSRYTLNMRCRRHFLAKEDFD